MTDEKSSPLVPTLRFPEFRDAGEWEEKSLGDVCNILRGYGFPETMQGKSKGKYPFCKVSDVSKAVNEKGGSLGESANYIDENDLSKLKAKLIPKGSTVFAKIGEALRLNRRAIAILECLIDNNVAGLKAKDGLTHDYFIFLLAQQIDLNEYCGGAIPSVNKATLESIQVYIPTLPEQQKIAACLSSLDELITAHSKKLDALKKHKKGLMQQLFPAEGQTVPSLRFPEFSEAGEWVEKKLGEIGQIITGNTPSTTDLDNYGGNKLFVSPADISEERYVVRTKTTLSIQGFRKTKTIEANSILFVCIGSTIGKIAQNKFECATNQQINSIIPYREYSNDFVYSALENSSSRIAILAGNHAVPIINKTLFSSILIRFPSLPEQQKIAACLSSLDELITAHSKKLDALKKHKKGLMQQLFPVVEED